MSQTDITVVGTVVTKTDWIQLENGTPKTTLRIVSNERKRRWSDGEWVTGDSLYLGVVCWRTLADHVHGAFAVGDPIIVRGRLITREWADRDGRRQSVVELVATAVGPDLARCTARLWRMKRAASSIETDALASPATDGLPEGRGDHAMTGAAGPPAAATIGGVANGFGNAGGSARNGDPADEGDPWQSSEDAGDGSPAEDEWPDELREAGRETEVEAAVGS